ncbi:hypothetical protein GF1_19880 [Desulfolithobacter dissulfuricans]|uniref:Cytochrome c-type protein n=1 Tax=Desulfolithobacter dissulfuricans TaxID=2795293 RepID=A0A915XK72_9BACT|nr:NapC/NirT family cytochrome c [Desulfolithobacter dissulfuricans]BCO09612.1 hypothetical protein GF1_19880 [Desulfolithobacter dissulfuricans]
MQCEEGEKNHLTGTLVCLLVWALVAGVVVVMSSGFVFDLGNRASFCGSCHVMKPFVMSWQEDVHGGQNRTGSVAHCNQCHLPHDNLLSFLESKITSGVRMAVNNLFIEGRNYDWAGNARENRNRFVHDSGCMDCHGELEPPGLSEAGVQAHREYLAGRQESSCTGCHPRVGHRNGLSSAEKFFYLHKGG